MFLFVCSNDAPPGLLVDLIDPVGVVLCVDVVEAVVLEPEAQGVKLTHALNNFHQRHSSLARHFPREPMELEFSRHF